LIIARALSFEERRAFHNLNSIVNVDEVNGSRETPFLLKKDLAIFRLDLLFQTIQIFTGNGLGLLVSHRIRSYFLIVNNS
jgi:hypothetical protein